MATYIVEKTKKEGKQVVDKESGRFEEIQKDLDKFVEEKQEHVIWKTEEGAAQLDSVVKYKINNPSVSVRTLCEYLIKKCNWTYSQRYKIN